MTLLLVSHRSMSCFKFFFKGLHSINSMSDWVSSADSSFFCTKTLFVFQEILTYICYFLVLPFVVHLVQFFAELLMALRALKNIIGLFFWGPVFHIHMPA